MQQVEMSLVIGRAERDKGIAKTTTVNSHWMDWALTQLPLMKLDDYIVVTGEQIRMWLETRPGSIHPTSPHAWGALTSHAIKRGILRDTGRVCHMKAIKSHARRTPIWELI
jgi:hypothetical protein